MDNPIAQLILIAALLLLVIFGLVSSIGVLFTYIPGLRERVQEQIDRWRGR